MTSHGEEIYQASVFTNGCCQIREVHCKWYHQIIKHLVYGPTVCKCSGYIYISVSHTGLLLTASGVLKRPIRLTHVHIGPLWATWI